MLGSCVSSQPCNVLFSTGRRICIGEHLAKMELYIFFTHMMHRFTFKNSDDSQDFIRRDYWFSQLPRTFHGESELPRLGSLILCRPIHECDFISLKCITVS